MEDTTESSASVSCVDVLLSVDVDGRLSARLCSRWGGLGFSVVGFPYSYTCSNIPFSPVFGVYISRLVRCTMICSAYDRLFIRGELLADELTLGLAADRWLMLRRAADRWLMLRRTAGRWLMLRRAASRWMMLRQTAGRWLMLRRTAGRWLMLRQAAGRWVYDAGVSKVLFEVSISQILRCNGDLIHLYGLSLGRVLSDVYCVSFGAILCTLSLAADCSVCLIWM